MPIHADEDVLLSSGSIDLPNVSGSSSTMSNKSSLSSASTHLKEDNVGLMGV